MRASGRALPCGVAGTRSDTIMRCRGGPADRGHDGRRAHGAATRQRSPQQTRLARQRPASAARGQRRRGVARHRGQHDAVARRAAQADHRLDPILGTDPSASLESTPNDDRVEWLRIHRQPNLPMPDHSDGRLDPRLTWRHKPSWCRGCRWSSARRLLAWCRLTSATLIHAQADTSYATNFGHGCRTAILWGIA